MSDLYTDDFYAGYLRGSFISAQTLLTHLFGFHAPRSVVDVGCGQGAWLAACEKLGAQDLVGLDGHWVNQDKLLSRSMWFKQMDLNKTAPVQMGRRFDLAMSLEVAEHLVPESSGAFVAFLTSLSDAVLFGAAFCWQPGDGHINNRLHSFWGRLFDEQGYVAFDIFRFKFWNNPSVEPWYRQNTLLYCKKDSAVYQSLMNAGIAPCEGDVLDVIHPWHFNNMAQEIVGLRSELDELKRTAQKAF